MLALPKLEKFNSCGIEFISDNALYSDTGIRIAFSARVGGASEGQWESLNLGSHVEDNISDVMENRELLLKALCSYNSKTGLSSGSDETDTPNYHPVITNPRQVHGDTVFLVSSKDQIFDGEEGDGVVCNCKEIAPLLCFADCAPVILAANDGAFAVVHAGWRGVVNKISAKAFSMLVDKCECEPGEINAYVGAHIRQCCFEVGDEVAAIFRKTFGENVLCTNGSKFNVSMSAALKMQLMAVGLKEERFCDLGLCTKCNEDLFYSYRATDGKCGRHGAIAFR